MHAVDDVAARGEHEVAVAAPQDRLLEFVMEACNLRQRHGDAVSGGDGQRRQTVELETLVRDGTRHHVDVLDALAILRDGVAREQRLQRLRHVLRRQPKRAGAVLVDLEADRLHLFAPVEVRVDDLGICRHDWRDLLGDLAHLHRIGADHAELHREAHRRTEHEAVDPRARFRQRAIGKRLLEPRLDALAGLQILGDDDDLGEVRVRQHRVEPKPEARRALADIGGVGDDVGIAGKEALGLLGGRVGDADRGAFRAAASRRTVRTRVEVGKNCCWTRPKPAMAATNIRTVTPTTVLRQRKARSIKRRSAR